MLRQTVQNLLHGKRYAIFLWSTLYQGRSDGGVYIWGIYTHSISVQINFLWGKNDVKTVIEQFYTSPKLLYLPKTNFWLRPCPVQQSVVRCTHRRSEGGICSPCSYPVFVSVWLPSCSCLHVPALVCKTVGPICGDLNPLGGRTGFETGGV